MNTGRAAPPPLAPLFAVVLVLVTAGALLVRLPGAISSFDRHAKTNGEQSQVGREIAASDLLDIDNEFLVEALRLVRPGSKYAVVEAATPELAAPYGIVPTTYHALPAYVLDLLLPSRQVEPAKADYLLCYACDTKPFDPHMTRLWVSPKGFVIGRLRR